MSGVYIAWAALTFIILSMDAYRGYVSAKDAFWFTAFGILAAVELALMIIAAVLL